LKAMLGYADHVIRNHLDDWGQYVHPDDGERVMAQAQAHLDGLTPQYEVIHRMLHKEGGIRWFLARGNAIRDAKGRPYRVLGTDTDITERKQAEEALQRAHGELEARVAARTAELVEANEHLKREIEERTLAEKALRESEERFRKLFDFAPDTCFLSDLQGNFIDGNRAAQDLTGYTKEELIGKNFLTVGILPAEEIPRAGAALAKNMRGKPAGPDEFILNRKDGTRVSVEISTIPVAIDGRTLMLGIAHDITERKQAERALQEREKELEIKSGNLEEANAALKVLLKRRDEDKTEFEGKVLLNVKDLVQPYLEKLKASGLNERQKAYAQILEANLHEIISPFSRTLSSRQFNLSPTEIQVANLVKDGKTNKEIAESLNSSPRTVAFHRENIRKKLDLKKKRINLQAYLQSLP